MQEDQMGYPIVTIEQVPTHSKADAIYVGIMDTTQRIVIEDGAEAEAEAEAVAGKGAQGDIEEVQIIPDIGEEGQAQVEDQGQAAVQVQVQITAEEDTGERIAHRIADQKVKIEAEVKVKVIVERKAERTQMIAKRMKMEMKEIKVLIKKKKINQRKK